MSIGLLLQDGSRLLTQDGSAFLVQSSQLQPPRVGGAVHPLFWFLGRRSRRSSVIGPLPTIFGEIDSDEVVGDGMPTFDPDFTTIEDR